MGSRLGIKIAYSALELADCPIPTFDVVIGNNSHRNEKKQREIT